MGLTLSGYIHIAHHAGGQRAVITLEDECRPGFYIVALDFIYHSPFLVGATFVNKIWSHNVKLWSLHVHTLQCYNGTLANGVMSHMPYYHVTK